jgi:hypothetical protein
VASSTRRLLVVCLVVGAGCSTLAQQSDDPILRCYQLDHEFTQYFDRLAILVALFAAIVAPYLASFLAGKYWWAANPTRRWWLCVAPSATVFSALAIALPVLASLGHLPADVGGILYAAVDPSYFDCKSEVFQSFGFLFGLLGQGNAASLLNWINMPIAFGVWLSAFSVVYWTWARSRFRWS